MSGGHWEYIQYRFNDIAEDVQKLVDKNGTPKTLEELTDYYHPAYPEEKFHTKYDDEIIEEFKNAVEIIKKAEIYIQRIDWLLSDDDSDSDFKKRLKDDLSKL